MVRLHDGHQGRQVLGYDVIPLPDNHVALVIGDVQGHSAGVATLMGQCAPPCAPTPSRGTRRTWWSRTPNRLLVDMESDLFATCCYVDVDLEDVPGQPRVRRQAHLRQVPPR
ncbi:MULTISPECIES: SpoIIE family protein phosphatase [unclassified Streptomyces]|uniref:SpoIIE family protein phosphatase n=1 Tax=unclassified Streptomyces TaxID=2593676 RepID=UPI0033A55483